MDQARGRGEPDRLDGPFYPTRDRKDEDPDLTQVRGRPGRAAGDLIVIQGRVLEGWVRPPHIRFRVSRRGYHELVTQMHFAGESLNDADRIRLELAPEERDRVTVTLQPASAEHGAGVQRGEFDITLRRAG